MRLKLRRRKVLYLIFSETHIKKDLLTCRPFLCGEELYEITYFWEEKGSHAVWYFFKITF